MDEPPRDNCNISLYTVIALIFWIFSTNKSSEGHTKCISSGIIKSIIGVIRNIHSPRFFATLLS